MEVLPLGSAADAASRSRRRVRSVQALGSERVSPMRCNGLERGSTMIVKIVPNEKENPPAHSPIPSCISPTAYSKA